jgi:hypothetical protein
VQSVLLLGLDQPVFAAMAVVVAVAVLDLVLSQHSYTA